MAEELAAIPRAWQRTLLVLSKDSIAAASDKPVEAFAQEKRGELCDRENFPDPAQPADCPQSRLGTGKGAFRRLAKVREHHDRVEIIWLQTVTAQESLRQLALQRREPKLITTIMSQQERHQPIAESANAVVEDKSLTGRGHGAG